MGIEKLVPFAIVLAVSTAANGRLPEILKQVRVAQYKLLKASQSSNWGKAMILPIHETKTATENR